MGGGLARLLTIAAILLIAPLAACESDDPKPPTRQPGTVEEFFEALEFGISGGDGVFHAVVDIRVTENAVESHWGTTEGWVAEGGELARAHWQKAPGNTNDIPERTVHIHHPEGVYSANPGSDDDPDFRPAAESELCLPQAPTQVLALVACAFLEFGGPEFALSVENSTFDGRPTVVLVGTYPVSSPVGSEQFPVGGPTPHPVIASATTGEYRLHLDAESYLPVAAVSSLNTDPDRKVFGSEMRFETPFVQPGSLPKDWFEPASIGYVPPGEEERRKLERADLQTPVYWLGRSFDPGNGLPLLGDLYVNDYGPRPSRGDEPNIQLGLAYRGAGGFVRLDLFPPGDWEEFKARLGGNFPWSWCGSSREFSIGDASVTILGAHESFPYREGAGLVQPGSEPPRGTPPAPTLPPLVTLPCPDTPHDRFMAEVRFPDATVVLNGTLSYGGQDGRSFGVFDDDSALEAVARGVKLRRAGE